MLTIQDLLKLFSPPCFSEEDFCYRCWALTHGAAEEGRRFPDQKLKRSPFHLYIQSCNPALSSVVKDLVTCASTLLSIPQPAIRKLTLRMHLATSVSILDLVLSDIYSC